MELQLFAFLLLLFHVVGVSSIPSGMVLFNSSAIVVRSRREVESLFPEGSFNSGEIVNPAECDMALDAVKNTKSHLEQFKLTTQPMQLKWTSWLLQAPFVVTLLSQLAVISSKTDFSLNTNRPTGSFKYIRNPDSFRATVLQVANEGWQTFYFARKNMQAIKMRMLDFPHQVNTILQIVKHGSAQELKLLAPIPLKIITRKSEDSHVAAKETQHKFDNITLLLDEVTEASVVSKGITENKLFETEIEINVTQGLLKDLSEQEKLTKTKYEDLTREVSKWRNNLEKAIDEIPTGWDRVLQDFVGGLGDAFCGGLRGLMNPSGTITGAFSNAVTGTGTGTGAGTGAMGDDTSTAVLKSLMASSTGMFTKMRGELVQMSTAATNPQDKIKDLMKLLPVFQSQINNIRTTDAGASGLGQQVSNGLESMVAAIQRVDQAQGNNQTLKQALNEAMQKVQGLASTAQQLSNQNSIANGGTGGSSNSEARPSNEVQKAQLTHRRLEEVEKQAERAFESYMKLKKEMSKLNAKVAKKRFDEIQFTEIIQLLRQAINLLTQIKVAWAQLVNFFADITIMVKESLVMAASTFVDQGNVAQQLVNRTILLSLMKQEATKIYMVSALLYGWSSAYVDLHDRYINTQLAGLGRLLTIDNAASMDREIEQIIDRHNKTNDEIDDYMKQLKSQIMREFDNRIQQQQNVLDKCGHLIVTTENNAGGEFGEIDL